jgi:apolipoprotein N-acyltransferase
VLLEFARAFVFSLLWLGKESFVGPYWTFGFLGYPAAWSSVLVPFAPLGGVYLVGFIAVLLNYFFFISLRTFLVKRDRRPLIVPVVFFVALVGVNFFPDTKDDHIRKADIKIAAVSTNFPDTGFAGEGLLSSVRREDALKKLLNEAVSKEPDVVIFPEGSNLAGYLSAEVLGGAFASGRKLTILDSRSKVGGNKEGGITSELLAINGDSPAEVFYEKKFLMPHGEYLPYVDISVAGIFGQKDWINNFVLSRGYKAGDTVKPYYGKEYSIGALFCSEVIPESLHRELAKSGAEFFVNVASQADFHGSNVLYNQTLSLAKMKAASNGKYFVEAGNFVPSFVLDDKGSILAESKRGEDGVLTAEIKLNRSQTPYTRFGNWILWVSMLIVLYGIVRRMTPR